MKWGQSGAIRGDKVICAMPTTFRLLTILATMAALAYAGIWALANLVTPTQSEISIRIPSDKVNPPRTAETQTQPADNQPVAGD